MNHYDPFSQPPLSGSKSDELWVRSNASLFSPKELRFILRLFGGLFLGILWLSLVWALLGWWGVTVFVYLLAAGITVRIVRKRRRRGST